MTVLPFTKKSDRYATILELIHSYVWGLSRIESLRHIRYFVTFIDDSTFIIEVKVTFFKFLRNIKDVLEHKLVIKLNV